MSFIVLAGVLAFATGASPAPPGPSLQPDVPRAITPEASPASLAGAMGIASADLASASLGASDPRGVGVVEGTLSSFPRQGETFAVLATGLAESADDPDANNAEALGDGDPSDDVSFVLDGLNNSQGFDLVQLTLVLTPPPDKTSLSFDFGFYSEEFPDFINNVFNDAFIAELGAEPFSSNITIVGDDINAPANVAFDPNGEVISVNAAYGFDPLQPNPDTGTTYDGTSGLLRATGCLPEVLPTGNVVLVLSITDLGDFRLDSAVFLDNFQWGTSSDCTPGAQRLAIDLVPQTATNPVGTSHTVTATVRDDLGDPIPGRRVGFVVNGAHVIGGSGQTNAGGQATFSFTGVVTGTDAITAWIDENENGNLDFDERFAEVEKIWVESTAISLTPPAALNPVGATHTVTATVLDNLGDPMQGQIVGFWVSGANQAGGQASTDAGGQATFSYTGDSAGQDTIIAWVDKNGDGTPDSNEPAAQANAGWEDPTAITLAAFGAAGQDGQVLLTWETASELENEGFHLWRSTVLRGPYVRLNPALIPARGNETTGQTYTYLDGDVANGVTYYYKLEDVDSHGLSDFHGPVSATPSPIRRVFLPLIAK
ncbi:MAG: Ig-like domain-containing protein [Anaerolineae bacterium]